MAQKSVGAQIQMDDAEKEAKRLEQSDRRETGGGTGGDRRPGLFHGWFGSRVVWSL